MTRDERRDLSGPDGKQIPHVFESAAQREREQERERDILFAAFEEAPVFLSVVEGPELRVTMINRRVRETLVGPTLVGRTAREVYPDDNAVITSLERVFATGVRETVHGLPSYFPQDAKNDRYFTREFVPLRDEHGNVNRVLQLVYEVTEEVRARHTYEESERRNQAELQRLFALLEEAPILINVLEGPELRLVMMNRRSREFFAGRDMIGVSFHDAVPADNATLMAACRVYETGVPETLEVVARDVEGFIGRSFSSTVVPIFEPNGRITRIMVASLEFTEQRRSQEALEAQARDLETARRQAVEASRAKDEFLAMLGHELRNPLAPMVTTLGIMRLRSTTSRDLDILDRQVHRLRRLVDDLRDVSRIARGKIELKRRELDLSTIVNDALEMTNPLIEQRRHRVITELVPAFVQGDHDRLAQAVANLITNAAKYSEVGSQIRIQTRRSGELVILVVADDGIGIAPDMIGSVFDAFVQHTQTLARSQGGLGLGLSIVKGIVGAHGGKVSAHSDGPGKGSEFVIELPASNGQSVGASVPRRRVRPSTAHPASRILVVDDNYDAAATLQSALEELGHTIAIAHDGPSALAKATTFKPRIGLLDIGLPVMDGYELAVALRAAHDIRLVAITGYGQARDRRQSRAAGFERHLVKPIELEQLARLIHQMSVGGPSRRPRKS